MYYIKIEDGKVGVTEFFSNGCPKGYIPAPKDWTPDRSILEFVDGGLVEIPNEIFHLRNAKTNAIYNIKETTDLEIYARYEWHEQANIIRRASVPYNTTEEGKLKKKKAQAEVIKMDEFIEAKIAAFKETRAQINSCETLEELNTLSN